MTTTRWEPSCVCSLRYTGCLGPRPLHTQQAVACGHVTFMVTGTPEHSSDSLYLASALPWWSERDPGRFRGNSTCSLWGRRCRRGRAPGVRAQRRETRCPLFRKAAMLERVTASSLLCGGSRRGRGRTPSPLDRLGPRWAERCSWGWLGGPRMAGPETQLSVGSAMRQGHRVPSPARENM